MVQAVFVVVGFVALVALAVRDRRLRARLWRLERDGAELSRTVAAVQGWAAKEIGVLRGELTAARLNASAAEVIVRRPPSAPAPKPSNDQGETTTVIDRDPPRYARCSTMDPSGPLAHPDLIGCEDIADEAARPRLGPEDKTPPRRGRTALLVPVFEPEEGGAA